MFFYLIDLFFSFNISFDDGKLEFIVGGDTDGKITKVKDESSSVPSIYLLHTD